MSKTDLPHVERDSTGRVLQVVIIWYGGLYPIECDFREDPKKLFSLNGKLDRTELVEVDDQIPDGDLATIYKQVAAIFKEGLRRSSS